MPNRPVPPSTEAFLNDIAAQVRAMRTRLLSNEDGAVPLQTLEDGGLLGDTAFLNFGAGLNAQMNGPGFVTVDASSVSSGGGFDALVDGEISASDTAAAPPIFQGIGEALTYLDGLGLETVAVGVRPIGGGSSGNTAYVETANWSSPGAVRLWGLRGGMDLFETLPAWDWGTFRPVITGGFGGGQLPDYALINFGHFIPGTMAAFGTGGVVDTLYMENVGTASIGPTNPVCGKAIAYNCGFDFNGNATHKFAISNAVFVQCDISTRASGGTETWQPVHTLTTGSLLMVGCRCTAGSSGTSVWNVPRFTDLDFNGRPARAAVGPQGRPVITFPASAQARVRYGDLSGLTGTVGPIIVATSAFDRIALEGEFSDVTMTGAHTSLSIAGQIHGACDITGPAVLSVQADGSVTFILRGEGICGNIGADGLTGSSGTFLSFVAADVCNIQVGADGSGTSGTKKSYALDASSGKNILDFAGDTTFPVAGTDAGAANLIRVT